MAAAARVLAGDVGGTNARLALVELTAGDGGERGARRAALLAREQVKVGEQGGLEGPLAAFAAKHAAGARLPVCLGVAAPVVEGAALMSGVNMPWRVDAGALERAAAPHVGRVTLVNDFFAAARGLALLRPEDTHAIGGGAPRPGEPVAILGAGTGLGQAFVLPGAGGAPDRVMPTEGGHRDFGPRDPLQDRLLASLRGKHGRVSTERVLSGPGLVAIYEHLVAVEGRAKVDAVEAAIASRREAGPPIVEAATSAGPHPTCVAALDVFVSVYGAEAANVALTAVARGGVFLAGGIAPAVLTRPAPGATFRRVFEDAGRFRELLASIPTRVVLTPDLGLLGAASVAASG